MDREDCPMKPVSRLLAVLAFAAFIVPGFSSTAQAIAKKEFNIAWTIYVGWMPWPYAAEAGIVKKWADKYGITIKITQINDYVESINQYTAGKFDGVTVTNMDALTIPAAGGVDTTAIIMGDFSNGNDGIVLKNAKSLSDIKGRKINIVELSVSHYLLARGLTSIRLREKDIKTVNTSDADIVAAFKSPDSIAVVTLSGNGVAALVAPARVVGRAERIAEEVLALAVAESFLERALLEVGVGRRRGDVRRRRGEEQRAERERRHDHARGRRRETHLIPPSSRFVVSPA